MMICACVTRLASSLKPDEPCRRAGLPGSRSAQEAGHEVLRDVRGARMPALRVPESLVSDRQLWRVFPAQPAPRSDIPGVMLG